MKTRTESLHAELSRRLPFVAFEVETIGWESIIVHARTISEGYMFHGESPPMEFSGLDTSGWKEYDDMRMLDRIGAPRFRMAVEALEDLADAFDQGDPTHSAIAAVVVWLRTL